MIVPVVKSIADSPYFGVLLADSWSQMAATKGASAADACSQCVPGERTRVTSRVSTFPRESFRCSTTTTVHPSCVSFEAQRWRV